MRAHVLIVEDDRGIRATFGEVLRRHGFVTTLAENGKDALAQLGLSDVPCVILLDLMMPVMDGWEFLAARAKDARISAVPVVIVSAAADGGSILGAVAVLPKPVHIRDLLAVVQRHCACDPAPPADR